ncbi:hypothetical protein BD413DRAFT_552452 [Trametes elegans]|nr:hypothetical protein BD413DRAFT_552452 [Trametes elegans]
MRPFASLHDRSFVGLSTGIIGCVVFVLAVVQPQNLVWDAVSIVSDKLYAFCTSCPKLATFSPQPNVRWQRVPSSDVRAAAESSGQSGPLCLVSVWRIGSVDVEAPWAWRILPFKSVTFRLTLV